MVRQGVAARLRPGAQGSIVFVMKLGRCSSGAWLSLVIASTLAAACSSSGGALPVKTGTAASAGAAAGQQGSGTAGGGAAGAAGAAGDAGTAGAGGGSAGAAAGAAGTGSAGAAAGAGGTAPDGGGAVAGGDGAAGAADAGTADGAAGASSDTDILKVWPSAGCGLDPNQALGTAVRYTMQTSGMKDPMCADSRCGAWSYLREYFVTLPAAYDKTKAYPIYFEGPGCGGKGSTLGTLDADVQANLIRVGLSPSVDAQAFHATNPGQGCFDDKEGDDSIEWPFYEKLYDQLAATVCFDRNRVFAGGVSSGAWLGNELGCKYAGDPQRPVRAVLANQGGLPTQPQYAPTCTNKGMAGFWVYMDESVDQPFTGDMVPIARAIVVDRCDADAAYSAASSVDFPIGGGNAASVCKRLAGCSPLYPLVECKYSGPRATGDSIASPGFSTFIRLFSKAPLAAP
jgi:hypothetical protein